MSTTHKPPIKAAAAFVVGMTLSTLACGDGATEPPATPTPSAVWVTPAATVELSALGDTAQLSADVRDQQGQPMAGAAVTWASEAPEVATVDGQGLVTAVGHGSATITASAGSVSGSARAWVAQEVDHITLPASVTVPVGDTLRLVAEARDANGHVVAEPGVVSWASDDISVATVDASGLVRGVGEGSALITATAGGASGTADIAVLNPDRAAVVALHDSTDGHNWVNNDNWLTDAPLGDWYGLGTDEVGRVVSIDLGGNGLSGAIPPELGGLASLERLDLSGNGLSGTIPAELGDLANLEALDLNGNHIGGVVPPSFVKLPLKSFNWSSGETGVCMPGTSGFVEWLDGMNQWEGPYASDQAVLSNLFELTSGHRWAASAGWLGGPALERWHGVRTDTLGRVTALELSDNGLAGTLPDDIGGLERLARLRIDGNALVGRLPLSLMELHLDEFHYGGTELCAPADDAFRAWLGGIGSLDGTGTECATLTDREMLAALYEATGGPNWVNSDNWLTDAPFGHWYGVATDEFGRVVSINLGGNGLSGAIPPELGGLSNLEELRLGGNDISGGIPGELGDLASLKVLLLQENELTGTIPPELGGLSDLEWLVLNGNDIRGAVPPSFTKLPIKEVQLELWADKSMHARYLRSPRVAGWHVRLEGAVLQRFRPGGAEQPV